MVDDVTKLPEGLLASNVLAAEAAGKTLESPSAANTPDPSKLPVDPSYVEPVSTDKFAEVADHISRALSLAPLSEAEGPEEVKAYTNILSLANDERGKLIHLLIDRLRILQTALLPFATGAVTMSNTRMCLIAAGRPKEPAGGIWLNNIQSTILQPNEGLFFNAWDAIGRQRVHDYMLAIFKHVQEATKLQEEKQKHIEDGGSLH